MQNAIAENWSTVARLYKNHMDQIFGAIFGPHFWSRFWAKVLDQIWTTIFGAILEPKFPENWEKKSAWLEKSHPAKQKKMLAPRVRITMRRQGPRAPIAVSVNACGPCRLIVQCAARS